MNIIVMGAGYVGLVTGACFAELGNHVTCVDVDETKIANLKNGILPIYEPGLANLIQTNLNESRLHFVTHLHHTMVEPQVIFIAVGTPSDKEGGADMHYVLDAAKHIGEHIKDYCVIVDKSTVPVGMADEVKKVIRAACEQRQQRLSFDVVSNPEFLREGAAIQDFMHPDRIIIGLDSDRAKRIMLDLYLPILRNPERIYFMRIKEAEMTKYAANAMLATRISFMNEIALLCDAMEIDIESVRIGMGSDSRIGNAFIYAGCGYGGSCFPKDIRALVRMAEHCEVTPLVLNAVEGRNFQQKQLLAKKIKTILGEDLRDFIIAVWGLAFKPGTDDMREASSIVLIEELIQSGAQVKAYDPAAMEQARRVLPKKWFDEESIILSDHQYDALKQADILVLVTEWKPFCYPDLTVMKNVMRQRIILDGRNQYDPLLMREAGFDYYGIGRGTKDRPSIIHPKRSAGS